MLSAWLLLRGHPGGPAVAGPRGPMALVSGAAGASACSEAWCAAVAAASMDGFTGEAPAFASEPAQHSNFVQP